MDIHTHVQESIRLLTGVEDGTLSAMDSYNIANKIDYVMTSLIVKYLRKKYPATNQASSGVIGRLVDLTGTYPQVVQLVKKGEDDPISEWFEETYSYRDFYDKPEEFVSLIIDKIEG